MVSRNSAASYFSLFKGVLKLAYRDKYLRENPNDFLEKIESRDIHKEFLTQDELKTLASTPCDIPVLRNASLFSCLTGLRISDILNLKWENLCTALIWDITFVFVRKKHRQKLYYLSVMKHMHFVENQAQVKCSKNCDVA